MTAGFIGLGNMGRPMSANLAAAGFGVIGFDAAGSKERAPDGVRAVASLAELVRGAETVFLSLPDGPVVHAVCREIAAVADRAATTVVDLSTIGIDAAKTASHVLGAAGIAYIDAPVSGGVAGARAASLALMAAGDSDRIASLDPMLDTMAANRFVVGSEPGQGQAMKVLNNFLSGTAMAATAEAIRFGERQGLDMKLMLDVLNVSSGQNTATSSKFPNQVLTGAFATGFTNTLLAKDIGHFLKAANAADSPTTLAALVSEIWATFAAAEPSADHSRIYEFLPQLK